MRTYFYLNNKRVSKSFLESLAGKDVVKMWVEEAKYVYHRDPRMNLSRYTQYGFITIEFK